MQSAEQRHRIEIATLVNTAIGIIDSVLSPQKKPTSLAAAMASKDALQWVKAWDAEVTRHTDELRTWTLEEQHGDDIPLLNIMTFRSKTNQYGELENARLDVQSGATECDQDWISRSEQRRTRCPKQNADCFSPRPRRKDTSWSRGTYLGQTRMRLKTRASG